MAIKDLTQQKFFRLKPLRGFRKDFGTYGKTFWECLCDCGQTVTVEAGNLVGGNSTSCGCWQQEKAREAHLTHGQSLGAAGKKPTHEYSCWQNMLARCTNQNRKDWKYYGGKGIKVCERWLTSFENFFEDLGPAPSPKHSLERGNSDGNYEPRNVSWATHKQQMNNFSRNRILEFRGQSKTLAQWAEYQGLSPKVLEARLNRLGWDLEKALLTPLNPQ
jgi:hypothetical protein